MELCHAVSFSYDSSLLWKEHIAVKVRDGVEEVGSRGRTELVEGILYNESFTEIQKRLWFPAPDRIGGN